jgi:hypothetical protein
MLLLEDADIAGWTKARQIGFSHVIGADAVKNALWEPKSPARHLPCTANRASSYAWGPRKVTNRRTLKAVWSLFLALLIGGSIGASCPVHSRRLRVGGLHRPRLCSAESASDMLSGA